MKSTIFINFLFFSSIGISQTSTILDHNNVAAAINTTGIFFQDQSNNSAGYEVPKGSGANAIFSSAFWFGGLDPNGQLHFAGQRFGAGQDMFNGPVASNYNTIDYIDKYENKLWVITEAEIQNHVANFQQIGYIVPSSIMDWPANGNTSNGEAQNLAPYVDYNANGIYDPQNGDYPNIRGDKAVYLIFNDDGVHTETGGTPLKMEFHFMFYQYAYNNYINNTTFINLRVINRSQLEYDNFKVGYYVDPDIGSTSDDYIGCSPLKNMMFAYNGDAIDDDGSGTSYGANPPAVGIKFLNQNMDVFAYFNNSGGIQTDPSTAAQYWGFMNAMWGTSGVPFTFGGNGSNGTVGTNYIYPGNPNDSTSWSETTAGNSPADRRMMGSTDGITFLPNQTICYDYAVLYNRSGGDNLANVNGLYGLADQAQAFFNAQPSYTCLSSVLGNNDKNLKSEVSIYPNPSNGDFKIRLYGTFDVRILSVSGEIISELENIKSDSEIGKELTNGIYILQIIQNGHIYKKKILIK